MNPDDAINPTSPRKILRTESDTSMRVLWLTLMASHASAEACVARSFD
jgi:hypothetical protein